MQNVKSKTAAILGTALALGTNAAMAAPPDVTAVVTGIGEAVTPIGLIGGAVLLVLVAVAIYKWVRRTL